MYLQNDILLIAPRFVPWPLRLRLRTSLPDEMLAEFF